LLSAPGVKKGMTMDEIEELRLQEMFAGDDFQDC
jgi:hypothetical protein